MAEIVLVDEILDRERRRQEAERVEPAAGLGDRLGDLVAAPQLGLEVGAELVVDDEARARERLEPRDDDLGERSADEIAAALERREPHAVAGDVRERDVGERTDEDGVALAQRVGRRCVEQVQRGDERAARAAAERARARAVDDVEDELGRVLGEREAALLERDRARDEGASAVRALRRRVAMVERRVARRRTGNPAAKGPPRRPGHALERT